MAAHAKQSVGLLACLSFGCTPEPAYPPPAGWVESCYGGSSAKSLDRATLGEVDFDEVYDPADEDRTHTPMSAFARDQGVSWYDHDFLEYGFSDTATSIEELVAGYSYSDQWGAEFARRVAAAGLVGVNWFAFISAAEIERPRSVQGDGYRYHYLGTITYPI